MQFPIITELDDVLAAVDGREEFAVSRKPADDYIVVDYIYQEPDTFEPTHDGLIRRECRGLIFDHNERLISRPFHKFFNVGEKEWTLPHRIDVSEPHVIQEKMDGSMVRPFYLNGEVRFGTRAGLTDVATRAERIFYDQPESNVERLTRQLNWIRYWLDAGYTPIFEFISPKNRIVVQYESTRLVLLALRHNRTGTYITSPVRYPGPVVPTHEGTAERVDSYIRRLADVVGREGDVLIFLDGTRYKMKTKWYLQLHRLHYEIGHDHLIITRHLAGTLDDVIGMLNDVDRLSIKSVVKQFNRLYQAKLNHILRACRELSDWVDAHNATRRDVALEFVPRYSKRDARFFYFALDGRDIRLCYRDDVLKNLISRKRYDALTAWMREAEEGTAEGDEA